MQINVIKTYRFLFHNYHSVNYEIILECGIKFVNAQTLIIGGTIASKDHYPWQVGVYRKVNKDHICGGSIVSVRVVISGNYVKILKTTVA